MNEAATETRTASRNAGLGRPFVHPAFDLLLIGGGLSLLMVLVVMSLPKEQQSATPYAVNYAVLVSNSAHFASSTVRLYSKPGSRADMPFVTMGLPTVMLLVLALAMSWPTQLGPHLNALYLTWSPFHYAAQAYGLAVLYAYRSGCRLSLHDKRALRWVSLVPFFYVFAGGRGSGAGWLLPSSVYQLPWVQALLSVVQTASVPLGFLTLALVWWRSRKSEAGALPLISVCALFANAAWFLLLPAAAFFWATLFHGVQYLAIVTIFHVKDELARDTKSRGAGRHAARFYAQSLALGFALFHLMPRGFEVVGFGPVEATLLSVAAINVHHFIVDGFIWKFRSGSGNRRIVDSAEAAVAAAGAA